MIAGFLCICGYKSTKLPWRASLLLLRNKTVECHITTDATFSKYVTPYKSCKSRIGCIVLVVPPLRQYQLEYIMTTPYRKEYNSASTLWHFLIFVFIISVLYTCITSQHVPAVLCISWICFVFCWCSLISWPVLWHSSTGISWSLEVMISVMHLTACLYQMQLWLWATWMKCWKRWKRW